MKTSLGWVPYMNLYPMSVELKKNKDLNLQIIKEHPSELNKMFNNQNFSLAPCSSINLLASARNKIFESLGIVASGEVMSVYLGLSSHQSEYLDYIKDRNQNLKTKFAKECAVLNLDTLAADTNLDKKVQNFWFGSLKFTHKELVKPVLRATKNSATSVKLAKLLLEMWFGHDDVLEQNENAPQWDLLIGDEALKNRNKYVHLIDLGQQWKNITQLPFVYAVWMTQNSVSRELTEIISKAAETAEIHMHVEPCYYYSRLDEMKQASFSSELMGRYWKTIRYKIRPLDLRGLAVFLSMAIASKSNSNLVTGRHFQKSTCIVHGDSASVSDIVSIY